MSVIDPALDPAHDDGTASRPSLRASLGPSLGEQLLSDAGDLARTTVVAVPLGAVSVGVVARVCMFVLAQTNPSVAGMTSDDGFTIHQFTLSGSLNLALVGAVFGALSGVCWTVLAPLKTGPAWFRRTSISVGAGVVVGSQLVHSDGIDFPFLDNPALLAVAMFVLIPVLHVLALDVLAVRVQERGLLRGPRWRATGLVLALPMAPLVAVLAVLRALQHLVRQRPAGARWVAWPGWPWVARAVLTVLFAVAVVSLGSDIAALT